MIDHIATLAGIIGTLTATVTSVVYFRRAKRAEVQSKEITTADQMIELVKKANAEALELNRKENEKLRRSVSKLEKAIRSINICAHRSDCPVATELQEPTAPTPERDDDPDR